MKFYNAVAKVRIQLNIYIKTVFINWHMPCKDLCIAGMVQRTKKEIEMNLSSRNHITSVFAAVVCAFVTIGMSVAPAITPLATLVA